MIKKLVTAFTILFSFILIYVFSVIIGNSFDGEISQSAAKSLEIYNAIRTEDNAAVDDIVTFMATHQIEHEQFEFCRERGFFCVLEELERPELNRFITEKEAAFQEMSTFYRSMKSWSKSESTTSRTILFLNFHQAYLYYLSQLVHDGKVEQVVRHLIDSQKFYTSLLYHKHTLAQKLLFLRNMQLNKNFLQVLASEKVGFKILSEERALFIPKLNSVEIIKASIIGEFGYFSQVVDGFKANPVGLKDEVSFSVSDERGSKALSMASNPESAGLSQPHIMDYIYNYFLQPNASKNEYYNFTQASLTSACGSEEETSSVRRCDREISWQGFGESSFYLRNWSGNRLFKLVTMNLDGAYKNIQMRVDELAEETEPIMSLTVEASKIEVDPHKTGEAAPAAGGADVGAPAGASDKPSVKAPKSVAPKLEPPPASDN